MASVVTYWSGTSKDVSVQSELLSFIETLAALNTQRARHNRSVRTVASETGDEPKPSTGDLSSPNIIHFDQMVAGRILLGSSLILLDQFDASMLGSARPLSSPEEWQSQDFPVSLAVASRHEEHRHAIFVSEFKLRGIAFRLYDPRHLYPGEDWMSFAFLHAPGIPELDGQIVRAISRPFPSEQNGDWFQNADWVFDTPSLHLRYYLEEWFDLLMTWVKIFFISDLEYWRDTVLNRYDELKQSVDRLIASEGREVAKQAVFEYLLERFEEEADRLEDEIAEAT